MKIYQRILGFFRSLAVFITVILLCLFSLYGVVTPNNNPYSSFGFFHLAPFPNGLSLYQPGRNIYYAFSPLNDYFVENGKRNTLISPQDYSGNVYRNDLDKSKFEKIKDTLLSYFLKGEPEISYTGKENIRYISVKNDNGFTITREYTSNPNSKPEQTALTLLYKSGDYVFDEIGNLYSYKSDNEIDLFYRKYGFQLRPTGDNLTKDVFGNKICVVNPNLFGVICLVSGKDQTIAVNRNSSLVEVEQKAVADTKGFYKSTVKVVIADSPKEAFRI